MGYNDEQLGPRVVLDIETCALADADGFLEPVAAPANYKDPEKIRAYQDEKRAELLGRCALDPDLCKVVAVGMWADQGAPEVWSLDEDDDDEEQLIGRAWTAIRSAQTVVGFNILGFDLPVLIRRSQYLGIAVPFINLDRYRTPHVDLMERLSFNGKLRYRGLDFYCKRFGIAVEDAHSGRHIAELIAGGDWDAVVKHCQADVIKTRALAERLGYMQTRSAVA
jgi:predicted PolB exonuclease-like 3'-5' exonuclease